MLYVQGSIVEVSTPPRQPLRAPAAPPRRGSIEGFSKRSRSRLMKLLGRLQPRVPTLMITFTFRTPATPQVAKRALRAWLKRARRQGWEGGCVWRIEQHKSGASHIHMLMPSCKWVDAGWARLAWHEVLTGQRLDQPLAASAAPGNVDIQRAMSGSGKMNSYISKMICYVAKQEQGPGRGVDLSSPHIGPQPGRVWGIEGRQMLPWAAVVAVLPAPHSEPAAVHKVANDLARALMRLSGRARRGWAVSQWSFSTPRRQQTLIRYATVLAAQYGTGVSASLVIPAAPCNVQGQRENGDFL